MVDAMAGVRPDGGVGPHVRRTDRGWAWRHVTDGVRGDGGVGLHVPPTGARVKA